MRKDLQWKFRTWNLTEKPMDVAANEAETFLQDLERDNYGDIVIRQSHGYLTIFAQPEQIEIVCDQCGEAEEDCTCEDDD